MVKEQPPEPKSLSHHFLAVWLWANDLCSLNVGFFICKSGALIKFPTRAFYEDGSSWYMKNL